ncbi:MAG: chorismate synthase [Oscillospiraceae bacterium]|nr:chorismate synthase [Oscillospiraceae bacterium]
MSSCYGNILKLSIFGQSHSAAIGFSLDGLPAGFKIDMDELGSFMARRAPGKNKLSTARSEADALEFLSGLVADTTCGAPLAAIIRNTNVRSSDYSEIRDVPRPSHADFTSHVKYKGFQDVSGGGHFSGRLTAPLCGAGGICLQLLKTHGINVYAHIKSIHGIDDVNGEDNIEELKAVSSKTFPVIDDAAGEKMQQEILSAKENGDSVGGIIECIVTGMPVGVGEPMFDGLENRISSAVFGIPAVRGIEFGAGFEAASMFGSEHNDPYTVKDGNIVTTTNNHGGILGGISSGMSIVFRVAIKPTPSIFREQDSVSLSKMADEKLTINGRHDPCIVPRAVPCIEAAAALAITDSMLQCGMISL